MKVVYEDGKPVSGKDSTEKGQKQAEAEQAGGEETTDGQPADAGSAETAASTGDEKTAQDGGDSGGSTVQEALDQAPPVPKPEPATLHSERARVADPVERYLAEIRRYPILDRTTERVLTDNFEQTGDPTVAVRLITANLRLVVKIALEYQSPWMDLLDLIQEGNMGLLQAVRKFDPSKNIRLSSYAQWWIRAYILKFLMDNHRLVKVGTTQAQRKLFYNLTRERERLERQGFRPTARLLAKALSVRVKDIIEMESRLSAKEVSLDVPIIEGDRESLVDLLPADRPEIDEMLSKRQISRKLIERLEAYAETLKGRDAEIWSRRLMAEDPVTLQALGNLFGVSRERARQLEARVLRKLKKFLGDDQHLIEHLSFPLFS